MNKQILKERIILAANGLIAEEIIRRNLEGRPLEFMRPVTQNKGIAA